MRVFRAHHRARARQARTSSPGAGQLSGIELTVSSQQIESLAQHLRTIPAFQASTNTEELARVLAQIALIVNHSMPKVAAFTVENASLIPTTQRLWAECALECVIEYARNNQYSIDAAKLPEDHFVIGLMTNDEHLLTGLFQESLRLASRIAGSGRHARQTVPTPASKSKYGEAFDSPENELTKLVLVQSQPAIHGSRPRLSESDYWNLRRTASLERWTVSDVLTLIERRLTSAEEDYMRTHSARKGERYLTARSYWNLRSIAALKAWTIHECLMLIEVHLSPPLSADFAYYSDSQSGQDWERLYHWVFPVYGRI
jgi:hypothetical protein